MKRLFQPLMDSVHRSYERMFLSKAPRSRSTKIRRYEHVDVTKEFEILKQRREALKQQKVEELYEKHD